jgi:hypothetical protein
MDRTEYAVSASLYFVSGRVCRSRETERAREPQYTRGQR